MLLQVRLRAAVEDFISEGAAPAERMIRDLVDCEHAYINTDHPQFIGGNRALSQVCSLCLQHDLRSWLQMCLPWNCGADAASAVLKLWLFLGRQTA